MKNQFGFYLSDQEFADKWKEFPSPSLMSKETKITVRAIQSRRRSVELKLGIKLETAINLRDEHNKKQSEEKQERIKQLKEKTLQRLEATQHSVRRGMELDNGRVIVFSDAHFADYTTTGFKALLKFIEHFKPKAIICNGDAFDGAVLSRYPSINYDRKPSVLDELNYCKIHLDAIEKIRPAGCRLIWTLGNHDMRYESALVSKAPEFSGVEGFNLKFHFPNWETCWSFWVNDDTVIKHRHKGGRYAGYNNVQASFCNIFTGHTHVLTCSPISTFDQKTYWGVQTGTLADINAESFQYTEDNAKDWRQGFIMASWEQGRLLMPEMVMVCGEDEVEFRGEVLKV
jgi:Icc-related predicted phosphoesterase